MLFSIETVTVGTDTSHTLSLGAGGDLLLPSRVRFTSCKVIKSNGPIKTPHHRSNMRLLLLAAAGPTPNAISRPIKPTFLLLSSYEIKTFIYFTFFLNQVVNLIVFSALVGRPPESITQRVQPFFVFCFRVSILRELYRVSGKLLSDPHNEVLFSE